MIKTQPWWRYWYLRWKWRKLKRAELECPDCSTGVISTFYEAAQKRGSYFWCPWCSSVWKPEEWKE